MAWRARRASSRHLRKEALWSHRQDSEEYDVTGEQLPAGVNLRADRLRNAENDASGKRAPHAAQAADDHRLETEDQPGRTDGGIEVGPHGKEYAGNGDHR